MMSKLTGAGGVSITPTARDVSRSAGSGELSPTFGASARAGKDADKREGEGMPGHDEQATEEATSSPAAASDR